MLEEIDKEEIPRESSSNFRSYSKSYSKFGFTIHNIALIVMRSLSVFNDGGAWSGTYVLSRYRGLGGYSKLTNGLRAADSGAFDADV